MRDKVPFKRCNIITTKETATSKNILLLKCTKKGEPTDTGTSKGVCRNTNCQNDDAKNNYGMLKI